MDCGAACVATLCRHFGHNVSLPAIRAAVGTGLDGTSLRGIMRGGAQIGIEFRAIKSSPDRLPDLPKPLILHWGGYHWVVLHELRNGRARLADPALGLRTVTQAQLAEEWSGYAAIPAPTPRLTDAPRGGLTLSWLLPFLRPHYRMLVGAGHRRAVPVGGRAAGLRRSADYRRTGGRQRARAAGQRAAADPARAVGPAAIRRRAAGPAPGRARAAARAGPRRPAAAGARPGGPGAPARCLVPLSADPRAGDPPSDFAGRARRADGRVRRTVRLGKVDAAALPGGAADAHRRVDRVRRGGPARPRSARS
jgi:peptidase C39-like protein